ncbi:MAG: hypothetical protein LBF41_03595 [Deltaproteobacteria bacterium]|jgi:hypothetical protein|nr:hypothetical protein [Deltaproteobacteria bacterium]
MAGQSAERKESALAAVTDKILDACSTAVPLSKTGLVPEGSELADLIIGERQRRVFPLNGFITVCENFYSPSESQTFIYHVISEPPDDKMKKYLLDCYLGACVDGFNPGKPAKDVTMLFVFGGNLKLKSVELKNFSNPRFHAKFVSEINPEDVTWRVADKFKNKKKMDHSDLFDLVMISGNAPFGVERFEKTLAIAQSVFEPEMLALYLDCAFTYSRNRLTEEHMETILKHFGSSVGYRC